jgi:hypothetical protein
MGQQPLRRDIFVETYGNAAAYRKRAVIMEHDGWRIMDSQQIGQTVTVRWYRDVPASSPVYVAPSRSGMHPLAIIGIIIGAFVLLGVVGNLTKSGRSGVAATPTFAGVAISVDALESCMRDGFGATSWYPHIQGYRLSGTTIYVNTNLFYKDDNRPTAMDIRAGVISCANIRTTWVSVQAVNESGPLASGAIPGR